jgi:lipid-A-disaccharide synthase-like uncharacterized protein
MFLIVYFIWNTLFSGQPLISLNLFGRHFAITWWEMIGFAGNLLFTIRVLIQWVASERRGRTVVPATFWWLSLAGSLIMIVYAFGCGEPLFVLGFAATLIPYTRNLMIHYRPGRPARPLGPILAVAVVLALIPVQRFLSDKKFVHDGWFYLGALGILIFYGRFSVQWVLSERRRESVMPLPFWYMSLVGSLLLVVYSVARGNLPFLLGFIFIGIPTIRNIMLIRRERAGGSPDPQPQ